MPFSITPVDDGLALEGELDVAGAPRLRVAFRRVIAGRDRVDVDLSGVAFIDSAGLHALVEVSAAADRTGTVVELRRPARCVRRLVELTHAAGALRIAA